MTQQCHDVVAGACALQEWLGLLLGVVVASRRHVSARQVAFLCECAVKQSC
jgi:hypothetical protein